MCTGDAPGGARRAGDMPRQWTLHSAALRVSCRVRGTTSLALLTAAAMLLLLLTVATSTHAHIDETVFFRIHSVSRIDCIAPLGNLRCWWWRHLPEPHTVPPSPLQAGVRSLHIPHTGRQRLWRLVCARVDAAAAPARRSARGSRSVAGCERRTRGSHVQRAQPHSVSSSQRRPARRWTTHSPCRARSRSSSAGLCMCCVIRGAVSNGPEPRASSPPPPTP